MIMISHYDENNIVRESQSGFLVMLSEEQNGCHTSSSYNTTFSKLAYNECSAAYDG